MDYSLVMIHKWLHGSYICSYSQGIPVESKEGPFYCSCHKSGSSNLMVSTCSVLAHKNWLQLKVYSLIFIEPMGSRIINEKA